MGVNGVADVVGVGLNMVDDVSAIARLSHGEEEAHWKKITEIISRISRSLLGVGLVALDISSIFVTKSPSAQTIRVVTEVFRRVWGVTNFLQSEIVLLFSKGLKGEWMNIWPYLEPIGSAIRPFAGDISARVFTNPAHRAHLEEVLAGAANALGVARPIWNHATGAWRGIQRALERRRALHDPAPVQAERKKLYDPEMEQFEDLLRRMRTRPEAAGAGICGAFEEEPELQRYICPITHEIIMRPLKDKVTGALFEEEAILQTLRVTPSFTFMDHGVSRKDLVPSPEDQPKIASSFRGALDILSNTLRTGQPPTTETPPPATQGPLTFGGAQALQAIRRGVELHSFVERKKGIGEKIGSEFDAISEIIKTHVHCRIDPRLLIVWEAGRETANAKNRFQDSYNKILGFRELKDRMYSMEDDETFIPGIVLGIPPVRRLFDSNIYDRIGKIPDLIKGIILNELRDQ